MATHTFRSCATLDMDVKIAIETGAAARGEHFPHHPSPWHDACSKQLPEVLS